MFNFENAAKKKKAPIRIDLKKKKGAKFKHVK
jgi:hypothetical protein